MTDQKVTPITSRPPTPEEARRLVRDAIWTVTGGAMPPAQQDMLENMIASMLIDAHREARAALLADIREKVEARKGSVALIYGAAHVGARRALEDVVDILNQKRQPPTAKPFGL